MKIYLASSWKSAGDVLALKKLLVEEGHQVDAFCDGSDGRFAFRWVDIPDFKRLDGIQALKDPRAVRAFQEDKKKIEWADVLILLLPAGRSSHLEAGYAKGIGKKVYFLGPFPPSDFELMYGFADGLFRLNGDLLSVLRKEATE